MKTRLLTVVLTIGILTVAGSTALVGPAVHRVAMAQGDSPWQSWINTLTGVSQMAYALWKLLLMATGTLALVLLGRLRPAKSA